MSIILNGKTIAGAPPPSDTADAAKKADLTSIIATGATNATGATIASGTYFYLNGTLVQAKADIAVNATFTNGTNYETVTAGGLNDLMSAIDNDHINYTDIDITGQAVTSVDTGGYYGGMNITSLLPAGVLPLSVAIASGGYDGGLSYTLQVLGTGTYIIFEASKPVTINSSNRKLRVFWKKWN